jgi:hypothetical protein
METPVPRFTVEEQLFRVKIAKALRMEVTQKPFTRKKPDQLVYLELGSGNGGMLLSISEDGFRFRAVSPLRPSGLMPFAFSLDGNRRLQGIGEVEWLEDDGKSGGMRFVEVSTEFRSIVAQWLVLDSSHRRSDREASPAAAAPLDTMEKIREELRRGYPQRPPSPSTGKESQETSQDVSTPKQEILAPKSPPDSQPRDSEPPRDAAERQSALNESAQETPEQKRAEQRKPVHTVPRHASPAPREQRQSEETPPRAKRPDADRSRPSQQRSQPFYPPPFTQQEESEQQSTSEKPGSAFLKKPTPSPAIAPGPAAGTDTRPPAATSQQAAPVAPEPIVAEPPQSRAQAHASADSLRRPFRPQSRSPHSERPYIPPPVDESFEAAWERAKLTAPPESPHLSRAAAGSIIGVALAVILGALAFNFRRDIGELVVDVGQRISGDNRAAGSVPSVATSENKSESQPATSSSGSETANPDKPDTASGTTTSTQPSGSSSNPANSHAAAGAAHEAGPGAPHNTASAPRDATVTRGSSPATSTSGAANRAESDSTPNAAAPSVPSPTTSNPAANLGIGSEPGSGQEEFNEAREMLKGDHRHRDLSKAVDLLWAGVRKGYVPAEVTLADLYRRGDGVAKNCDQAQVLLVAASKKGSPEARQMLEQMAEQGCSE